MVQKMENIVYFGAGHAMEHRNKAKIASSVNPSLSTLFDLGIFPKYFYGRYNCNFPVLIIIFIIAM